jgi:hypothetical protein
MRDSAPKKPPKRKPNHWGKKQMKTQWDRLIKERKQILTPKKLGAEWRFWSKVNLCIVVLLFVKIIEKKGYKKPREKKIGREEQEEGRDARIAYLRVRWHLVRCYRFVLLRKLVKRME